jgi:hypothetical protein
VIIPLFKSHYSIGKSILTLSDESEDEGSDSIFDIYSEAKLEDKLNNKIIIVEDSFMGFLQANESCNKLNLDLVFGLRIDINEDQPDDKSKQMAAKACIKYIRNQNQTNSLALKTYIISGIKKT